MKQQEQNGIPRRNRMDLFSPAELAIYNVVGEVEKVGADVRLTYAIIKLNEARSLVADYIDDCLENDIPVYYKPSKSEPIGRTDEELVKKISKLLLDYTKEHYESTVMLDCSYLAAEIIKLTPNIPTYYPYDTEMFQELFNYMAGEHNVTLLESEMDDIMRICLNIVGGKFAPSSRCQENDKLLHRLKLSIMAHPDYHRGQKGDEWHDLVDSIENTEKQTKV